ncbi:MAG TPA: aldose 1-epimerase [Sphingomicrobium sp.]|nr:aldose 1-epimerase [Sphingomicrobium sp.]
MASETTVSLRAGKLSLELSPSVGGAISAFEWMDGDRAHAILRRCNSPLQSVLEASSFPLVPFVNRIRGGHFSFRGRDVALKPNMAGDPSPLHGQGWLSPWAVEQADEREAALTFAHEAGEWPWSYQARQQFALDEAGLAVRLECRNTGPEPMPCGLGQHPYFPCGPETRLDTPVASVWTIDEHVLPVEKVPAIGRFSLGDRLACGQGLDHGFGGWGGTARMTDPSWPYDLRMSSPTAKFFQLYSPIGDGIFVAEPVSHANAALNAPEEQWPELGMRVLGSGEAMALDMRIEVIPK